MRIPSSSFVLASLAFSPALAAPTPTMPYDSPVPGSPRIDDWTESVRSPGIPRSPILPAVRVAGRRRSIPHFKRQGEAAAPPVDDGTASTEGLLGGLGDTLSGLLHTIGDVAGGLPIIGGLGILSTDGPDPSAPGSSPPPPQKRDDADSASAMGLLGGLGDSLDDALHTIADAANGLPILGDLNILSTDASSSPQKRDDAVVEPAPNADVTTTESGTVPEATTAPDASTPSAEPETVVAAHHRRSYIPHLRRQEAAAPPEATPTESTSSLAPEPSTTPGTDKPPMDPDTVTASHQHANRRRQEEGASPPVDGDGTASAEGLLGGLGDTLSGILHTVGDATAGIPIIGGLGILSTDGPSPGAAAQKRDGPPMSVDQLNALRQQVTALLLQQQQAQQAAATLSAASSSLPVDPAGLQQRLLALQNTAQGVTGGLDLQGLLGGLPIAGGLVSNTLSKGPLSTVGGIAGGLPVVGGVLSTAGGVTGGLPVVGGLLGNDGLLGGILGGGGGGEQSLLAPVTGAASGVLAGVAGDNAGIFQSVLSGGGSAGSRAFAPSSQMQWPDMTGLYPHSLVNGAPVAPPNSPASLPSSIVYGSLGMDGSGASPPVPPPSPASSAGSVPMDHNFASSMMASAAAMTGTIPAPSAMPSIALENPLRPRRVDGDVVGETPSQVQSDDHADGFSPSMPDSTYTPPLLTPSKRSDIRGMAERDMHEGGPDAVPGPQDRISGTLKAPRQLKMFRRLLRGASVSF